MDHLRKILASAALIVGAATCFNFFFFALSSVAGQVIWNIIDPIIVLVLAAITLINIAESVRIRRGFHARGASLRSPAEGSSMRGASPSRSPAEGSNPQTAQLPRDLLTALVAMTVMFYLHNYLLKLAFGASAANAWIWHLIVPPVVVMLVFEGISLLLRNAKQRDAEGG